MASTGVLPFIRGIDLTMNDLQVFEFFIHIVMIHLSLLYCKNVKGLS